MPHINRIRLVNVGNTNSTQFYDEFHMGLFGKNVTYDLINGGGKTFLIQMILQTILPNSYLDKKNPLKNIFEGGKDRSSHILVEWILDEGFPYKYLLSGFCAKGSKKPVLAVPGETSILGDEEEAVLEDTNLEFFNYTHLYNEANAVDIESLDLYRRENDKEEYKSLSSLKNYLRDLKKQGLAIYTFDTQRSRTEFKAFLNSYNIVSREWELIQQINQKENNIKSYFEQAKTSRKLVENLLIPIVGELNETSQDAGNRQGANLARELINIKEQFKEYQNKRDNAAMNEMNINRCEQLQQSCDQLSVKYQAVEQVQQDALYSQEVLREKLSDFEDKIKSTQEALDNNQLKANRVSYQINCLSIQKNEISKRELDEQKTEQERLLKQTNEAFKNKNEQYLHSRAQNKYLDYCDLRSLCHTTELKLQQLECTHSELRDQLEQAAYNYRLAIDKKTEQLEGEKKQAIDAYQKYSLELKNIESKIKDIIQDIGAAKQKLESTEESKLVVDEKEAKLKNELRAAGCIWFLDDEIEPMIQQMSDQIELLQRQIADIDQDMIALSQQIEDSHSKKSSVSNELAGIVYELKDCEDFRKQVEVKRRAFHQVLENYQINISQSSPTIMEGIRAIAERKSRLKEEQRGSEKELDQVKAEEEKVKGRDYYIPNRELSMLCTHLQSKLDNVFSGAEYLHHNLDRKAELLINNPLLPYAVLVNAPDLEQLKDHPEWIGTAFSDYAIPIIDLKAVQNNEPLNTTHIIYTANLGEIPDDVIASTKMEAEEIQKRAKTMNAQVGELNNAINQLIGTIENQKQNLGFPYEENEAFQVIGQIQLEIERLSQAKQDLVRGENLLIEQLTRFEKSGKSIEKEVEKIISYIEINNIQLIPAYPLTCSQRTFADIQVNTQKLNADVEKIGQEFQKRLALIKDDNFSSNLKNDGAPQTASSAQLTSDNIQRYISLAKEANVKLQADLERMAERQKQFITACYQPSEQLLSDLKKFDTFSKIEVHGKVRQMIQLILPEYPAEVKRLNMEKHIQHLIDGLDRDDHAIAANLNHLLSPAELLSKLVNMDQLQVKIYNIKQLKEQSRMVAWEKLSTSDGQGNAVYFIFLICLLSFIRDIKTEGKQAGSRKTIIADNLFGPTTALYLWQPMLNIIKENNVQLIAPGSQINPMIASNFEINYKMRLERREGGKSFVKVVPDLSTSVEDLRQLELCKIEEFSLFS